MVTATGEVVSTGAWNSGVSIPKTFSTTLDAAWVASNCQVYVICLYAGSGTQMHLNSGSYESSDKHNRYSS